MPDQLMQSIGQNEQGAQQELIQRLLTRVAQPRMVGPQPQPEMVKASQPRQYNPAQGLVHNLFGLIATSAQHNKEVQEAHAFSRINSINAAITRSYDEAQRQLEKGDITEDQVKNVAFDLLLKMPEAKSLLSKEGQKDMKQMEKLLQQDFLNPEKNRTVWHTALEKVAKVAGAEKLMSGIKALMGKHKDKMAEEVRKQGEAQHKQAEGKELLKNMMEMSNTQQADPSKILPSLISSASADVRMREREMFQDYERQMKEKFQSSIDSIKDPRLKELAQGIQLQQEGDEAGAQKVFDKVSKSYAATQKPGTMNLNKAIADAGSDDPKVREAAQGFIDRYTKMQKSILMDRGLSFGMGRLYNWYNQETGETAPMNGFQVQQALARGESWTMTAPVSPQLLLPAQQIVRSMLQPNPETGKNLREDLVTDMNAFDNASDRAIVSRVLRENPAAYAQDVSTLGIWLDQNLTDKLSPEGQKLVRDLKLYAEVFNRSAAITGQTRTEMNTMMLLALLPSERTPSKAYAMQQLQSSFNYLDGMVQAPLLGGGKLGGGSSPAKPAIKKDEKGKTISLDD